MALVCAVQVLVRGVGQDGLGFQAIHPAILHSRWHFPHAAGIADRVLKPRVMYSSIKSYWLRHRR